MYRKSDYASADEMIRRMKEAQRNRYAKECNTMIQAKSYDATHTENRRERKARRKRLLKRRLLIFFRDLDNFIDFSIARFIVWRATRHRN